MESQIDLLKHLIAEGEKFNSQTFCFLNSAYTPPVSAGDRPEWLTWKTRSHNMVVELTAENSPNQKLVREAILIQTDMEYTTTFERPKYMILQALRLTLKALEEDSYGELASSKSTHRSASLSNKIFVVHGHDRSLKTEVESFIHRIGLEPVVLHRQPDQGQTIIEKFEAHKRSEVSITLNTLTSLKAGPVDYFGLAEKFKNATS